MFTFMMKIRLLMSLPAEFQAYASDVTSGPLKKKMIAKFEYVKVEAKKCFATSQTALKKLLNKEAPIVEKLAPTVAALTQHSLFKKTLEITVAGSEKVLGKEKTEKILSKVQSYIPSKWMVIPSEKKEVVPSAEDVVKPVPLDLKKD